jgi:hypothetical protein|tara:strand:- start:319 stop:609 length:291 start_codon:yes stop_codon:yes gene_type:complete
MNTTSRNGLLALNVLLLVVLATVSLVPTSRAQTPEQNQYLAVAGKVNGLTSGVVYIVDTQRNQGELVASTWSHNDNRIIILGKRSLSADSARAMGR